MDAIKTEKLTKHYTKGFWRPRPYAALQDLTLQVGQGEVFGFLGPNGAGKTTTLKLLMQLIYPTSGHAEILGKPVGDVSVRQRIGYLPENPYFYDNLTAEELLVYFARSLRVLPPRSGDAARPHYSTRSASAQSGAFSFESSPRAWFSASALRRRLSTIPKSSSSTNRCRGWIRSDVARFAS